MNLSRLVSLLAAVAVVAGACSTPAATGGAPATAAGSSATPAGAMVPVKTAYQAILALAPMFIAQDLGFFTAVGIDNQLSLTGNAYDLLPSLSKGDIDVNSSLGVSAAWFNAVNSGLKIHAVADRLTYTCSSDNALVARTAVFNGGAKTPADLKGKKVAILAHGSVTEYWLQILLAQNGLAEADLGSLVTLPFTDALSALKTGAIDFTFLAQPLQAMALTDGTAKRISAGHQIVPDEELGIVAFSDAFIQRDNGTVAANWLSAWLKGVRYYQDAANKDKVIAIVAKWTKVDPAILSALYGTDQWPWQNPNGDLNVPSTAKDAKWMLDNKLITSAPDATQWYDGGPIAAAQKIVGGKVDSARNCASVPVFAPGS